MAIIKTKFDRGVEGATNIVDTGTEGTKVASGTTAQRGSTTGQWRYNTTTGKFEGRDASTFVELNLAPTVSSVDDGEVDSAAGGNQTIVITGTNFTSGSIASFVGTSATFDASTTTVNSATQITAVAPKSSFLNAQEPYKVKVTAANGLSGTSSSGLINVDNAPTWTTAAGSLGSVNESATGNHFTVAASDAEGDTVSYSLQSGSLGGLSLDSSTGVISGNPTDVSGNTTNSFTLRATAGGKTADRAFTYITQDTITDPSSTSITGWTSPAVENMGNGTHNGTYYFGATFQVKSDGTVYKNTSWEHPIFSKYSIRSNVNYETIVQVYDISSNFQNDNQTAFQFGVIWGEAVTGLAQNNTVHATNNLDSGNGVYIANSGYHASNNTGYYKGGSNHNATGFGTGNRESLSGDDYTNSTISIIIKADNASTDARKITVYSGSTRMYTFTQQISSNASTINWYLGCGYPASSTTMWQTYAPKLRYKSYDTSTAGINIPAS